MESISKSIGIITLMIFYELQKRENIKNRATIMMKSSPVKDWKDYEQRVYKKFKLEYPNIDIFYNVETLGKSSKTLRQVDTLVNSTVAGINVRIAIECKAYSRKIDVDKIESFANRLKQIGANHGVVITNEGFTKGAKNTAEDYGNITLMILNYEDLEKYEFTEDDEVDYMISKLNYTKKDFTQRQKHNTGFTDLLYTSFEKKLIVFKEGYTKTEYYSYKKLLENSAKVFRDFPNMDNVTFVNIAFRTNKEYEEEKYLYWINITKEEVEKLLNIDINYLRRNILNWREFLGTINKEKVLNFAKEKIKSEPYSKALFDKLCE